MPKRHCGRRQEILLFVPLFGPPLRAHADTAQVFSGRTFQTEFEAAYAARSWSFRLRSTHMRQASCGDRAAGCLGVELGLRRRLGFGCARRPPIRWPGRSSYSPRPVRNRPTARCSCCAATTSKARPKTAVAELLGKLHEIQLQEPSTDKLYSISELAYLAGKRAEPMSRRKAMELHGLAVVNAYQYLFDARFGKYRNPYDPEFRGACDLYNSALESTLRIIKKQGGLVPGSTHSICNVNQTVEATIVLQSRNWRAEDFEEFRFVSDYEIKGLQNHYHNYGLGVPLIAVRKHHGGENSEEKYYPPGLSFPVTAFMRVMPKRAARR